MMTKEGSTKTVNSITPGTGVLVLGCDHISHIVKKHFLFKTLLLYSQAQTNQVCSNDDQGRVYKNCKFHDLWGRVLVQLHQNWIVFKKSSSLEKIGIFEYAHRNSFQQANVIAYQ